MAIGSIHFVDGIRIPADVFDLEGFRQWVASPEFPAVGRASFLDGDIEVDMSPEELTTHSIVKTAITSALYHFAESTDIGRVLGDGALYVSEAAGLATEPDAMLLRWETLSAGDVTYQSVSGDPQRLLEIHGLIDLAVEVVSKYSVRKDTKELPKSYFRAGVREYWIVDARKEQITFQLFIRGARKFEPVAADRRGFLASSALGAKVKIERYKDRVGGDAYRLRLE